MKKLKAFHNSLQHLGFLSFPVSAKYLGIASFQLWLLAQGSRLHFTASALRGDKEKEDIFCCHMLHGCGSAAWVHWQPGQCKMLISLLSLSNLDQTLICTLIKPSSWVCTFSMRKYCLPHLQQCCWHVWTEGKDCLWSGTVWLLGMHAKNIYLEQWQRCLVACNC